MRRETEYMVLDLEDLGDTADEVAVTLARYGVTGLRGKVRECPIARWATNLYGEPVSVGCESMSAITWEVSLPEAVVDFVRRFDDGLYPELLGWSR